MRRDALRHISTRLQEVARESVECLAEVQRTGESESARVSAARCVLEQALRAADTEDVHTRLDILEQTVKSQKKGNDDERQNHAAAGGTGKVNGRA
jgi:hypothetical protein